jgi:hypothetical protein
MTKQPVALWLADALDKAPYSSLFTNDAAEELRRLHAVNADLLEALNAKRQWVGFTEEEINEYDYEHRDFIYDIEALLKHKNTRLG